MTNIERHGAITVVRPSGPLRAESVADLDQQVKATLTGGVANVVIDLSETPLIDGAGLEWLLAVDEYCCRRGGCVRLCRTGELCQDILRITAVGATFQTFGDLTHALGSFA